MDLERVNRKLEQDLKGSQESIMDLEKDKQQSDQKIKEQQVRIKELGEEPQPAKPDEDKTANIIANIIANIKELEEEMEKKLSDSDKKIKEQQVRIKELEEEMEKKLSDSDKKIKEQQVRIKELEEEMEKKLSDSDKKIKEQQVRIKELEEEMEKKLSDSDKKIKEQQVRIKELEEEMEKKLSDSDKKIKEQQVRIKELEEEMEKKLSDSDKKIKEQQARIKELEEHVVAQLVKTLSQEMKNVSDVEMKMIQKYAVDVTLDPDTAHTKLILSEDGKQVSHGNIRKNLPDNKERFYSSVSVLGKQSFSSGRFYYEVQVKGKTAWELGVVRESINRKRPITLSPDDGYWSIRLYRNEYEALADPIRLGLWNKNKLRPAAAGPHVLLPVREEVQKVGVFVDYEEGLVSFYDVEVRVHLYSFTGCTFTEKLYPYFSPYLNYVGKNSAPLIISPVSMT